MIWGIVFVNLAAAIYMIHVLKEYKLFVQVAQPTIEGLKLRSENLDRAVDQERNKTRDALDRVREAQDREADIKNEFVLIDSQLRQAEDYEKNLEMDMYKAEFKRSKQRVQS